jgi:hypothetical protein
MKIIDSTKRRHLMKEINPNYWAPHNKEWVPYREWAAPIPITNLPILANGDTLYHSFYVYYAGGPAMFYYRLAGNVLYNILGEGDYFDEDY